MADGDSRGRPSGRPSLDVDILLPRGVRAPGLAAWLKAVELKPDYFEANYNLGAMYFNKGAELVNKANNLPVSKQAEYDAAKKKYEAKFREAKPYLEKAYQLNPKDEATMQSLYQLYGRLNETAKAQEMKAALDGLKK